MHLLLACDSFKGTLSSAQIAALLSRALIRAGHTVTALPLADGGDGTIEAVTSCGFSAHTAVVTGPLGTPVEATWARHESTAVIEMAQASGINLLDPTPETALQATSFGTGELITAALDAGCTTVILGVGGSATTDGGAGMLTALGARLLTADGAPVPPGGAGLEQLKSVDLSGLDPRLTDLRLAFDVDNPLCGPRGAAAVYGPQKGAGPAEVARLDAALARFAARVEQAAGASAAERPGAGAAGGVGFAALGVLGAQPVPGADYILDLIGFHAALDRADAVITGEGRIDEQTLSGKGPGAVLAAAGERGLERIVVCGSAAVSASQLSELGAGSPPPPRVRLHQMTDLAPLDDCLAEPAAVLRRLAEQIAAELPAPEAPQAR